MLLFPALQKNPLTKMTASLSKKIPVLQHNPIPAKVETVPAPPPKVEPPAQPKPLFNLPTTKSKPPMETKISVQGIMIMNGSTVALIDNDIHVVGDKVQEMEIIEITTSEVKLRDGEEIKTLPVKK